MSKFALITAALLIVPSPVLAQIVFEDSPPPPAAAVNGAKAKSGLDKVVCRTEDTIGSRVQGHQVCMTVADWAERDKGYKDGARDLQQLANIEASNRALELQAPPIHGSH